MANLSTKTEKEIQAQIEGRKPKKYEGMTQKEELAARLAEELEKAEKEKKKKKKPKMYTGEEFAKRVQENQAATEKFLNK